MDCTVNKTHGCSSTSASGTSTDLASGTFGPSILFLFESIACRSLLKRVRFSRRRRFPVFVSFVQSFGGGEADEDDVPDDDDDLIVVLPPTNNDDTKPSTKVFFFKKTLPAPPPLRIIFISL